jgi:hypothetical protein
VFSVVTFSTLCDVQVNEINEFTILKGGGDRNERGRASDKEKKKKDIQNKKKSGEREQHQKQHPPEGRNPGTAVIRHSIYNSKGQVAD